MKKWMLPALGALALTACTPGGGVNIGQGFAMDGSLAQAEIAVDLVYVLDSAGNVVDGETSYVVTQPVVTFNVKPQSVGLNLTSADVEILDESGNRYADIAGRYLRNYSARVPGGFTCGTSEADTDQCAPAQKTPIARAYRPASQSGSLPLIGDEVGRRVAQDCFTGDCPTLKMRVIFNGTDEANRPQSVNVPAANLIVRVNSVTTKKEE
ncbi:hypothetical protein [Deinococcus maricopensis]|uniref:Lipoprotein n=1 Tax=Deinococcus maricopensis (strain DSM 21211 / LMG 22137 / NRRL B-23946 / LB-34) TaxID=709986 RepID=E8U8D1_DEIML|nr:hypothetical protein [Deinococcus maricopensis]ADV67320.1 hypothetical protein Deima_1671 [Deinococcus maricopensis DSM 21211]